VETLETEWIAHFKANDNLQKPEIPKNQKKKERHTHLSASSISAHTASLVTESESVQDKSEDEQGESMRDCCFSSSI
jgi:hypothetical protein